MLQIFMYSSSTIDSKFSPHLNSIYILKSNHFYELDVYPSSSSNYILSMLSTYCSKKFCKKYFHTVKEAIYKGNDHLYFLGINIHNLG